jgi:hypothetical protein
MSLPDSHLHTFPPYMRQFLKQALASTVGSLLSLTLFSAVSLTLVTAIIGAVIHNVSTADESVKVPEKSILTIDLSQSIVDLDPGKTLQEFIAGESPRVTELKSVLNAIDTATKDKRILAIYLDGGGGKQANSTGFATLKDVIIIYHQLLTKFLSIRWVRSISMAFDRKQCFSRMLLINMVWG